MYLAAEDCLEGLEIGFSLVVRSGFQPRQAKPYGHFGGLFGVNTNTEPRHQTMPGVSNIENPHFPTPICISMLSLLGHTQNAQGVFFQYQGADLVLEGHCLKVAEPTIRRDGRPV